MSYRNEFLENCIVLDTETTGPIKEEAEIIEFGYCTLRDGKWCGVGDLHNTDIPILPEISAITNITKSMLEDKMPFTDVAPRFYAFSKEYFRYFVAHNTQYDKGVLEKYIDTNKLVWLCTLKIAKKLHQNDETVKQFNLPYLRYRFELDIPDDLPAHRADADAFVAAKLLEHHLDTLEERGIIDPKQPYDAQIENWLSQPTIIELMPFGKHKGKKLEEVPIDYWEWALNNLDSLNEENENYDIDFATSVALAVEKILS